MHSGLSRSAGHQRHLFIALGLLVLVLAVDVVGLTGVGDPKETEALAISPTRIAAWSSLDERGHELLDKEHEAVVSEIRLRIEQEHLLFALKFALVGAILWAFLQTGFRDATQFEITPFAALAAWSAVVASAIVDLRVVANQTFLATLGGWARQYEQLALKANGASLGWEAFLVENLLSKSNYPALRVSGQILTALLFSVNALLFLLNPSGNNDPNTARISGAGAIISISIMTMAAVSIRPEPLAIALYLSAGILAAAVAAYLARASRASERSLS